MQVDICAVFVVVVGVVAFDAFVVLLLLLVLLFFCCGVGVVGVDVFVVVLLLVVLMSFVAMFVLFVLFYNTIDRNLRFGNNCNALMDVNCYPQSTS